MHLLGMGSIGHVGQKYERREPRAIRAKQRAFPSRPEAECGPHLHELRRQPKRMTMVRLMGEGICANIAGVAFISEKAGKSIEQTAHRDVPPTA
jgi:hypothetical protein